MSDSIPRIKDIRAYPLYEPREGPRPSAATNEHTLIEVLTDAEVFGIGSAYTSTDLVRAALGRLRPLYLNEIAIEPQRVHEKLEQSNFWWGRGGAITHTISGIDIALWDILGKVTGQPVSRLLGGMHRYRVRPYASLSFGTADHGGIEKLVETLQAAQARGFRAFKLGWGSFGRTGNPADDEHLVATARKTIGKNAELMIDAGGSQQFWPHGYKWALRTADMLDEYNVVWFEEPLPPDDLEGYKLLREHARVLNRAVRVHTPPSFAPLWRRRAGFVARLPRVGGQTKRSKSPKWRRATTYSRPHGWTPPSGCSQTFIWSLRCPWESGSSSTSPQP